MGRIDSWLRKAESRRGSSSARTSKGTAGVGLQQRAKLTQQQQQQLQLRQRMRRPSQLGFVADHSATPASSMLQSLLTLYGMLTLMLGVVIPISDALAKPVEHADYRQIFYIIMHGVGAVSIVYLDALIAFHKSDPKMRPAAVAEQQQQQQQQSLAPVPEVRIEDDSAPGTPLLSRPRNVQYEATPALQQQISEIEMATRVALPEDESSAASDVAGVSACGDRHSEDCEVTRLSRAEVSLLLPVPSTGSMAAMASGESLSAAAAANSAGAHRVLAEGLRRRLKAARTSLEKRLDRIKRKRDGTRITWSAAGVNIYLRLGSIIFGFGVMVHDGFKIVDVIEKPGNAQCAGPWFLPKQIIHLLFIVCQTYYLFKHHRVAINTQNSLVRFILVHLMVTNLCIWGKTVIYEIKLSLMHSGSVQYDGHASKSSKHSSGTVLGHQNMTTTGYHNGTAAGAVVCSQLLEEDSPSHKLGPYLYPCAVEYGLICAAICYKLFTRVGDIEAVPYGRKDSPVGPRATTCHKSHKGLFLGLFIMICVLVPTISLIFLQRGEGGGHKEQHALAVIAVECLVLGCTAAMALLGTAKAVRQLKLYKLHGSEAFDVNLLFVGLAGIVCYNLFVAISVGACLMDTGTSSDSHCLWGNDSQFSITRLTGLKSLMEVMQSVMQTLFVMQAIQRKVTPELAEGLHKPGRGVTIALLIANLAMWVASVFESQRDIADLFLLNYFGSMPWNIIKYIFLPLIIFYRFHSTVCLSEIWIQSYKLPKKQLRPVRS